jgi:hypothetical protein
MHTLKHSIGRRWSILLIPAILVGLGSLDAAQAEKVIPELSGGDGPVLYNSAAAQAKIGSSQELGELALRNSPLGTTPEALGFAAKSTEADFFLIGSLYSETLAMVRSGDLEQASTRLEMLQDRLLRLKAPHSLYSHALRARSLMQRGKESPRLLLEYLSLFQPYFEDYARGRSKDLLALFQMGSWLTDVGLTAATGSADSLRQGAILTHIISEMRRMDAPQGVQESLLKIQTLTAKSDATAQDMEEIVRLVRQIQLALG